MTDKIVVITSCETNEQAEAIAEALVSSRLAACVQVLPGMQSTYRWKGAVERSSELLLLIKTRRDLSEKLQRELERLHPYDLPEIIALPVVDGLDRYLDWVDEQTTPS